MTFQEILRLGTADPPQARAQLQARFGFPAGFWHPEDLEGALDVVGGSLDDLGLGADRISAATVQATIDALPGYTTDDEEDLARAGQIAALAAHVNASLEREGDRRLVQFANTEAGWESDEPVWLLVTLAQRQQLLDHGIVSNP